MNSEEKLNNLRKNVMNQKIPKALWLCLNYTEKHKQHIVDVGGTWIDEHSFILNTKIFSDFINRQIHTVNRNLREHGFKTKKIGHIERDQYFSKLNLTPPLIKSWCLRSNKDFTRSSEEGVIDQLPYKAIPKKSARKAAGTFQKEQISINSDDDLDNHNESIDHDNLDSPKKSSKPSNLKSPQITNFFSNNLTDFATDTDDSLSSSLSDNDQYFT